MSDAPPALAERLAAHRPGEAADALARAAVALAERLSEARGRWPDVDLDDAALADHVGARLDPGKAADAAIGELQVVDLFLACACARGDARAIARFEEAVRGPLRAAFGGVSARGVDPEDLQQRLFQRLFVGEDGRPPRIAEYSGRGSLRAWVKVAATRLRIDVERRRGDKASSLEDADARLMQLADGGDGELSFLKAHYRDAFKRAFQGALAELAPRERNLLRLVVVEGISATRIAALYQVDRATAKRWLVRARAELLGATRSRLTAALRVDAGEFESIVRMIQSNLEVSMQRLLDDAEGGGG